METAPTTTAAPSVAALLAENTQLREQVAELRANLAAAQTTIELLRRGGPRQTTPFSTGKRQAKPQKPGRKPGQGRFTRQVAPAPATITATVAVAAPTGGCPKCGGTLEQVGTETVTRTELPPPPPPQVTAYTVPVCRCQGCGGTVRGRHPEVAPDQAGATAHRLGERAYAYAHWLHYGLGVPVRKVPQILWELRGLKVTQGALTQAALRQSHSEVGQAYAILRQAVRTRPQTYTDDTGWKVGGEAAQLMGFETEQERVYQIRAHHRNEEVRELLPEDYAGTMITDRGKTYDAQTLAKIKQQKCLDHIDRSILKVLAVVEGEQRTVPETLRSLLWEARALWTAARAGTTPDLAAERPRIEAAVTALLAPRAAPLPPDTERLLRGLRVHHARGNLLRFLHEPAVEPTNNRAERALRPAVIARKVSHCSKTERGATAFSAFVSVVGTLVLRGGKAVVDGLITVMRTGRVPDTPP